MDTQARKIVDLKRKFEEFKQVYGEPQHFLDEREGDNGQTEWQIRYRNKKTGTSAPDLGGDWLSTQAMTDRLFFAIAVVQEIKEREGYRADKQIEALQSQISQLIRILAQIRPEEEIYLTRTAKEIELYGRTLDIDQIALHVM